MEIYISQQATAFLWSVVLGAALGVVNDCFRVGRILWKGHAFRVFLEDLTFSFIAAVATMVCLTQTNFGQVRLFLLLGEAAGFFLYFFTLGTFVTAVARFLARILGYFALKLKGIFRIFLKFSEKIIFFLKKPFIFFLRWFNIDILRIGRRKARDGQKSKEIESGR